MTLGQEFKSFASTLRADLEFAKRNVDALYEMNLGGTAIGTKICAHAGFADSGGRGTQRSDESAATIARGLHRSQLVDELVSAVQQHLTPRRGEDVEDL
jgi:aspartate ammonia-lyase